MIPSEVLESANVAVTLLSLDGIIVEANDYWRRVVGLDPAKMIGTPMSALWASGPATHRMSVSTDNVAQGEGQARAVPIVRPDGSTIYMDFSVRVVEIDGQPFVSSIGHDVTASVRSYQALEAAEARFRSLVEGMPDVVWTSDDRGNLLYITPNVEAILGYTPAEMTAEDLHTRMESIHPDDRQRARAAIEAYLSKGTSFDLEYRRRRKDGTWTWIRNRAFTCSRSHGARTFQGTYSDVTERRRLEESLRHGQKMEALGRFTGGIAHDFNNMLAAILANSHFLIEALSDADPRHEDAMQIKEAAERAAGLTRQLLAFSRHQILEPTDTDLNVIIGNLEKMLRRLIGEDVVFSVVAAAKHPMVRVDIGQIEQVIMNLAVNARDAMPNGGRLEIRTDNVNVTEAKGTLLGLSAGRYAVFSVRDTGIGMDFGTRRHLFEPFFTTKGVGKGTGLGLSTSYGIVKQSGGTISVASELGVGSEFDVYLPIVKKGTAARVSQNPDALGGTETILVIEDDAQVRRGVVRMLVSRGYRVIDVPNGDKAVEWSRTADTPVDLILSDVILPGGTGPEAVTQVQNHHPKARVLFMSGYTDHPALRHAAELEGRHLIQKPFGPLALHRRVRELLDRPASA
jgi:two-component system, cell cycle sensor histidine kinase and response regulator CckA